MAEKNQKVVLQVTIDAVDWIDEQEIVSQVSKVLGWELRNDPHVSFNDCETVLEPVDAV